MGRSVLRLYNSLPRLNDLRIVANEKRRQDALRPSGTAGGINCASDLLEVQEDVDGVLGVVGLHPVADVVVVNGQRAENIVRLGFELGQKILEDRFVENFALRNVPGVAQL